MNQHGGQHCCARCVRIYIQIYSKGTPTCGQQNLVACEMCALFLVFGLPAYMYLFLWICLIVTVIVICDHIPTVYFLGKYSRGLFYHEDAIAARC